MKKIASYPLFIFLAFSLSIAMVYRKKLDLASNQLLETAALKEEILHKEISEAHPIEINIENTPLDKHAIDIVVTSQIEEIPTEAITAPPLNLEPLNILMQTPNAAWSTDNVADKPIESQPLNILMQTPDTGWSTDNVADKPIESQPLNIAIDTPSKLVENEQHEIMADEPAPATDKPPKASKSKTENNNFIELRAAYFYPLSNDLADTYGGNGQYSLQYTRKLRKKIYAWAEAGYFTTSGHIEEDIFTRLTMIPCSLGLQFMYDKYRLQPYLGIGPLVSFVHTYTDSALYVKSLSKWTVGGLLKLGLLYRGERGLLVNLFADYAAQEVQMENKSNKYLEMPSVDLSGFSFGISLGTQF